MAPRDVNKGSARERERIKAGHDADSNKWDTDLRNIVNYVLVDPASILVCKCCFAEVADISQHTNKQSACALFMGTKHIMYCYENNSDEDCPNSMIISAMLLDEDCPVNPKDVLAQGMKWDPATNFKSTGKYGHTLAANLLTTSFHDLYTTWKMENDGYNDIETFDHFTGGAARATNASNLPLFMKKVFDRYVQKFIKEEIKAGRLTRVSEAPPPPANGGRA